MRDVHHHEFTSRYIGSLPHTWKRRKRLMPHSGKTKCYMLSSPKHAIHQLKRTAWIVVIAHRKFGPTSRDQWYRDITHQWFTSSLLNQSIVNRHFSSFKTTSSRPAAANMEIKPIFLSLTVEIFDQHYWYCHLTAEWRQILPESSDLENVN